MLMMVLLHFWLGAGGWRRRQSLGALCVTAALANGCEPALEDANRNVSTVSTASQHVFYSSESAPVDSLVQLETVQKTSAAASGDDDTEAFHQEDTPGIAPTPWRQGKTWVVYDPQPIYAEMKRLLRSAQESIRFDYYIFYGPDAEEMADILIERSQHGVQVRILLEKTGGPPVQPMLNAAAIYERLKSHSSATLEAYTSPSHLQPKQTRSINHNKNMVIDNRIMSTGGMNVGTQFESYRDLMVFSEGPAAMDLAAIFDADFAFAKQAEQQSGLERRSPVFLEAHFDDMGLQRQLAALQTENQSAIRVISTGFGRASGYTTILERIRRAKTSIDLQMSEFPGTEFADEIVRAHQRGVAVRALLDADDNLGDFVPYGEHLSGMLNAKTVATLLENGVPTKFFDQSERYTRAHLKMLVFDGVLVSVGTTNLDTGILGNCETNFELVGGSAVAQLKQKFSDDWAVSPPGKLPSKGVLQLNQLMYSLGYFRPVPVLSMDPNSH